MLYQEYIFFANISCINEFNFYVQLHMKAVEVRLLGKSVLIGQRECETKELFCPHPQLMTVNLNHAGSLKLSVIVTWK